MGIASTTTKAQANLNDYIYVKLTDEGYNILYEYEIDSWSNTPHPEYARDLDAIKATVDENGYKAFQMWDFMNIFGKHLKWGSNPLDMNVLIDVKISSDIEYYRSANASLLHQLELKDKEIGELSSKILDVAKYWHSQVTKKDKEIAMLQANITNISKP